MIDHLGDIGDRVLCRVISPFSSRVLIFGIDGQTGRELSFRGKGERGEISAKR